MERGRHIARALCIRRLRRHQGRPAVHRRLRQGRAPERRLPAESREGNCHHASFPFPPYRPGIYGGCRPGRESLSYRRVRTPRRAGLHQPGLHAGHTPDGTGMAGTGPAAGPRPLPASDGRNRRSPVRARRHRPAGTGRPTGPGTAEGSLELYSGTRMDAPAGHALRHRRSPHPGPGFRKRRHLPAWGG